MNRNSLIRPKQQKQQRTQRTNVPDLAQTELAAAAAAAAVRMSGIQIGAEGAAAVLAGGNQLMLGLVRQDVGYGAHDRFALPGFIADAPENAAEYPQCSEVRLPAFTEQAAPQTDHADI